MRNLLIIAVACTVASSSAAAAQKGAQDTPPTPVQQLLACRGLTDPQQRLACFDRHSATVDQAIASRDLVLVDREKARATSRSLFGLSIPDFGGIFGGGDEEEVNEIESTVADFRRSPMGGWTIKLADGSTWTQTDYAIIALAPRKGDKVVVKRGSFGSFFLRLSGQPGVRVKRIG